MPRARGAKAPSSRFSSTVIRGHSLRPSGIWITPRRTTSWAGRPDRSSPRNRIFPAFGDSRPEMVRRVVVLPAPLGPMSVTISPGPP